MLPIVSSRVLAGGGPDPGNIGGASGLAGAGRRVAESRRLGDEGLVSSAESLLEPARLDRLAVAGQGFTARVLRAGARAVKVAHPGPTYRDRLAREIELLRELESWPGLPVPRVLAARDDGSAFVRAWLPGRSLLTRLVEGGALPEGWLDQLRSLFVASESFRESRGVTLDFSPANLFFRGRRLVLVDGGERLDPSVFVGADPDDLVPVLERYLGWRADLEARATVAPSLPPPSGRFHVDVGVGRAPTARVLWRNRAFLARVGVPLSDRQLHELSTWATWAEPARRELPATRYQDGPDREAALGDGRSLWVGEVRTADGASLDCVLKGAGPTPLAWHGNEFHFDGFVSFNRTLWEASVCDELARLGFETPEVAAIASTGRTTVDNTRVEWPAAAALRLARTQLRLGHLLRWDDDPDAARALLRWAGARVVRGDFDPERPTHVRALVTSFAAALGDDVGRTDALCIHCFNPTMGNVRIDGHLIDFSTVRFHRFTLPDFIYMNERRRVRDHRGAVRRFASLLTRALRTARVTTKAQDRRLTRSALSLFDRGYTRGYARGLLEWLGLDGRDLGAPLDGARARNLVEATLRLRAFRADGEIEMRFWKQTPRAPLFDLEALLPDMVQATRAREAEPWRALRSSFPGRVTAFVEHAGRDFYEALLAFVGPGALEDAPARQWRELVRPVMEPERLAALCYERSTQDDFREWQRLMSTSARLPRGVYACEQAQRLGAARGHVVFDDVTIVGLTTELLDGLGDALETALGPRLRAAYADGVRVAATGQLVEGGADGSGSDALVLSVDAAGELDEEALTRALDRVGCPFPVEVRAGASGVLLFD
jgi:tRNA A-37 threonylcarbamoyl transferase component Bud32